MSQTISFIKGGNPITAELYTPAATPTGGLIVVAYGTDGLTDHLNGPWATMIRGYADVLVQKGFVVLIPDYFAATDTTPGLPAASQILEKRDRWQEVIADTIEHAKTLSIVDSARVGLIGFSLGGHLCLRLRSKANVLVEFFAPVFDTIGLPGTLTHAQIHHGKADNGPATDFLNAEAIKTTLEAEGTSTELFPYPGAGHGFLGDDPDNSKARTESQKRTISFFESHL